LTILIVSMGFVSNAQPISGDCNDSVMLGSERWPELKRSMRSVREHVKAGENDSAIELQHEVVSMQCHNPYQRYYLAELMVAAEDFDGAVSQLLQLDDLRVNGLEVRLQNPKNALHSVMASEAYAGSDLERRIAERKRAHAIRQHEFLSQLAGLPSGQRPQDPYMATAVCPFECCRFGRWSVLEDTSLYSTKETSNQIAVAKRGTHPEGLTGDLHLQPLAVGVVHPVSVLDPPATIEPGEIVFLLDTMGEGYRHVWHAGVVRTVDAAGSVRAACAFPGEDCWGEWLKPLAEQPEPVWWVKVRLEDGREGWSHSDRFGDIGGCG
jgi:hypothetical protein